MRIVYLLEDTPMFGGVKVVFRQAGLLARRGHSVAIVSPGERPGWLPVEAEFVRTRGLEPHEIPPADVTVATYWTTIAKAQAGASGEVVQYCQGFEGSYTHNVAEHGAIAAAYAAQLPALAVAPHLARLLAERFGRPARVLPQPLEAAMSPPPAWRRRLSPRRVPRLLVTGPFEIDWKGVATALEAVRLMRGQGVALELVRLSQWPQTEAEKAVCPADEFHCHLPVAAVPALLRSCDLLLAPSWEQEGFGLPLLEAMACGVPAVASDIAAFRDFAGSAATLAPFDQPAVFAAAAREILGDPRRWRRMRRAGLAVARGYGEAEATAAAEAAFEWVASGAWRAELPERPAG